jgi:hypothetical protein
MIHQAGMDDFAWQRSFYDHVIRDEVALNNIRKYIIDNPENWDQEKDADHLTNIDIAALVGTSCDLSLRNRTGSQNPP